MLSYEYDGVCTSIYQAPVWSEDTYHSKMNETNIHLVCMYDGWCEGISPLGYSGKRLTNRLLPKLSLITLSPPLNSGILGLRMGPYVPTPKFFYNLWRPRESDSSDSWHEEIHFSLKSVFMVDVRFELTTNDPWSCRRRHIVRQQGGDTEYPLAGLPISLVLGDYSL